MYKQILLSILLSSSFFGTTSLPAFSQDTNTKAITEKPSPQTTNKITVVKALIVKFPNDIEFDAGAKKEVPVVLLTVEPIKNSAGEVLIPANSRVDAVLVPAGEAKDKGTMIVAKSLIINGNSYPIRASVITKVPASKVKGKSRIEQVQEYKSLVSEILSASNSVTNSIEPSSVTDNAEPSIVTDNPESSETNLDNALEKIAGAIGGLSPRSKLASRISKGSEYIIHLQKPLRLNTTKNTQ